MHLRQKYINASNYRHHRQNIYRRYESEQASKPKPKVAETPSVNSNKIISAYQKEFNPEQIELLNFSVKGDYLIVKPAQYLKNEWNEINKVVKNIGGEWIKGSIISYWKIPI